MTRKIAYIKQGMFRPTKGKHSSEPNQPDLVQTIHDLAAGRMGFATRSMPKAAGQSQLLPVTFGKIRGGSALDNKIHPI